MACTDKHDVTSSDQPHYPGENYPSSNYEVLCSHKVDFLLTCAPDELDSFRDAPIIITKKRIWPAFAHV